MSSESYSEGLQAVDYALGYPVGLQDEALQPTPARRFTALSVLDAISAVLEADKNSAEEFDRSAWELSDEALAHIREEHRPHRHYLRGVDGLQAYYQEIVSGERVPAKPYHEHQIEVLATAIDYLEGNDPLAESSPGAYADISGGGGKTRSVVMVIEGLKYFEDTDEPNRVLIVTKDLEGINEIVGANGVGGFSEYAPTIEPGVYNKDVKQLEKDVVVTTRESARRLLDSDPAAFEQFDLIIGDEAHVLLGEKTRQNIKGVNRQILGFTGSPYYAPLKKVKDILPALLIRRTTRELIEADKLSPVQLWVSKTGEDIYADYKTRDYSVKELERISHLATRHRLMEDWGLAFLSDGRRGIFSCNTIEEAEWFAEHMNGREIRLSDGSFRKIAVAAIHGGMRRNRDTIHALDSDEIQAVTIVDIDTGWDAPNISFLVNGRPTRSIVKAGQRSARIYRRALDAEGKLLTAQVVDLVDTVREDRKQLAEGTIRQVLVPQLFGEKVYTPGLVIASAGSHANRRDFSLEQVPNHLQWPTTMAAGMELWRLPLLGAQKRNGGDVPHGYFTAAQLAIAFGVDSNQLLGIARTAGASLYNGVYFNQAAIDKTAAHYMRVSE